MPYMELYHHGIKGQKWGVRRFQNPDGTLNEAGKKRYAHLMDRYNENTEKIYKLQSKVIDNAPRKARLERSMAKYQKIQSKGIQRINKGRQMTKRQLRASRKVTRIGKKLQKAGFREQIRARNIRSLSNQNKRYEKEIKAMLSNGVRDKNLSSMTAQIEAGKKYLGE